MPSIVDLAGAPAKVLLIGKSGTGKTGSLAPLVAAGYNLRILDTDNGVRPLFSLLTDPRYPYANLIKAKNIDLASAVQFIPVTTSMKLRSVEKRIPQAGGGTKLVSERLLAPIDAKAWTTVLDLLDNWKDGDLNLGSVRTWTDKEVLVLDSFSTLSMCAYYFNQSLNGRLGARDEGFDYQRDIGGAQSQLRRLLELLYDSSIGCNVVVTSHITWVDESQGVANRPRTNASDGTIIMSSPDGYPSAIGRALSPHMGKYFNDAYIVRSTGSGTNVSRSISTVPHDGVLAKNSVYLDREYPVSHGLASIFAALRSQPIPSDLIAACTKPPPAPVVRVATTR